MALAGVPGAPLGRVQLLPPRGDDGRDAGRTSVAERWRNSPVPGVPDHRTYSPPGADSTRCYRYRLAGVDFPPTRRGRVSAP